jgi:gamma-glutamylcyclotransferase
MYYFGYGSNMAQRVMQQVCPGHHVMGATRLDDYRLGFTRFSVTWQGGVADVVPQKGKYVWGRLYEINDMCRAALDVKESYGVGYTRIMVDVTHHDGTRYTAVTYSVINKSADEIPATLAYKSAILEGAQECDFPLDYMAHLKAIPVVKG